MIAPFLQKHPFLKSVEAVEYYAVFDGYPGSYEIQGNLLETIAFNVLAQRDELQQAYAFLDEKTNRLLRRLAIGDRKHYKALLKENIGQKEGATILKELYDRGIILKEQTMEAPLRSYPKQRIKKSLRNYVVEDKIRFQSNFDRFWFTFCALEDDERVVMDDIKRYFDQYVSYTYEEVSCDFINQAYPCAVRAQSYWDRYVELDIFAVLKDGKVIIGECKWKNHRVSANVLINLKKKCEKIGLEPDSYLLFSKSGFSNGLKSTKDKDVVLYDVEDVIGFLQTCK
jgi:hypothetical protein